ncbi:hypothetical protein MBFIL_12250 [Methanobrevibacter filiformis]|uniref:Uncharacterized protein n=1 Tax=Methanobrevibacter filiformis TaxID=55758 RepID=A0A162FEZ3_9EURY|nr:hypothetical protein MBFIL_12250 [Methanobrevibacter filiformis]
MDSINEFIEKQGPIDIRELAIEFANSLNNLEIEKK